MKWKRKILLLFLFIAVLAFNGICSAAEKKAQTIRIALCHLDVSQGPQEKNIEKIERAIHVAGQHGANWILTPETALQGYYFYVIDPSQKEKITEQPSATVRPLVDAAKFRSGGT